MVECLILWEVLAPAKQCSYPITIRYDFVHPNANSKICKIEQYL